MGPLDSFASTAERDAATAMIMHGTRPEAPRHNHDGCSKANTPGGLGGNKTWRSDLL